MGEPSVTAAQTSVFVVVDIWRVKPGNSAEVQRTLAEAGGLFRGRPGVLSVDFTHLDGDPDRYLVVFRYASEEARQSFVATDDLKDVLMRLSQLWELESPIYIGRPSGF
jgi:heme-degrading monooxygenase HmoA